MRFALKKSFAKAGKATFGKPSALLIFTKNHTHASQLDFSAAWVIARDLLQGITQIIKCHHCGAAVLLNAREDASERCGVCKTKVSSSDVGKIN